MEVVLIRHGKVNYPPIKMLSAVEFKSWVAAYNRNKLDRSLAPTEDALIMSRMMNAVVCSDLPRSIESADYLGIENIMVTDSLFSEAGLPIAKWNYPKLSPKLWAVIFRIAWLFGYCHGSESFAEAKQRAKNAKDKLVQLASEYDNVLFIGHGIMNRLIARELRQSGWEGPKVPGNKNWEYGIYKNTTEFSTSNLR